MPRADDPRRLRLAMPGDFANPPPPPPAMRRAIRAARQEQAVQLEPAVLLAYQIQLSLRAVGDLCLTRRALDDISAEGIGRLFHSHAEQAERLHRLLDEMVAAHMAGD